MSAPRLEFKGVFPAPPTPVTQDGKVHEKALRALLLDNIAHGANGFWMAGSTGEGPILTDEQRDAVAVISAEACKGQALVIMHVGAMSTASAVRAAKTARKAGCAAVCCLPPLFFPSSERSRIEHYKAIADAAGDLPFFVYNLPQLTQVETVPTLMEKFARAIPTLKGLKHSAPNSADIRVFADMGLICFSGNGAFPLPALTMGAVGKHRCTARASPLAPCGAVQRMGGRRLVAPSRCRAACASSSIWSGCTAPRTCARRCSPRGSASTVGAPFRR
jgi:dihydrodipicolinate synthase/N-acetylneuraminate lyase